MRPSPPTPSPKFGRGGERSPHPPTPSPKFGRGGVNTLALNPSLNRQCAAHSRKREESHSHALLPSPKFGRGAGGEGFFLPLSQTWERGLGVRALILRNYSPLSLLFPSSRESNEAQGAGCQQSHRAGFRNGEVGVCDKIHGVASRQNHLLSAD